MVGTSLKSVLKLFLREEKLIGVCWLEISIRFLDSAKTATTVGIDAGIPDFVPSPSGKVERRSGKHRKLR